MIALVDGHLQGSFPLTWLQWNPRAVPGICAGPPSTFDGTSSQAHQLVMSLIIIISVTAGWQDPTG